MLHQRVETSTRQTYPQPCLRSGMVDASQVSVVDCRSSPKRAYAVFGQEGRQLSDFSPPDLSPLEPAVTSAANEKIEVR